MNWFGRFGRFGNRRHGNVTGPQLASIEARVHAGAFALDQVAPRDWRAIVRRQGRGRLNIGSTSRCTLAQLYGDYETGLGMLLDGLGTRTILGPAGLGFAGYDREDLNALTAAWHREIASRETAPRGEPALTR